MPSHSNSNLTKHIQNSSDLLAKMGALTTQLQADVEASFERTMGVPVPSAVDADVRQVEYSMVYSTDPIISDYMSGAKTLLDGVFGSSAPDVANAALDTVQTLLGNIIGSASIQTGGNSQSMRIRPSGSHGAVISAAFTQVEECSAKDWETQTNFYVAYYVYVVWEPSAQTLAVIEKSEPALA